MRYKMKNWLLSLLLLFVMPLSAKEKVFEQAAYAQSRTFRGELAELYVKGGREAVRTLTEKNLLRSNGGVLQTNPSFHLTMADKKTAVKIPKKVARPLCLIRGKVQTKGPRSARP